MTDSGAHFFQCDFQVHSPRDRQWTGKDCVSDDERNSYAVSLVDACRERGLGAIAITDHHDMAFIPYVRRAAADERDGSGSPLPKESQLVVFPGIELTLAVPCQAILLLDADFEENRYDAVLTALAINPADQKDAKTIETVRLDNIQSLKALKEKLDEHSWLKDRYIILPNVSGEGKFSLLRNGMMAKYKEMPCVGGYIDGKISKLKAGSLSILSGSDRQWGFKKTASIQTSDNRFEDHRDLACCTSWIKWAEPTAEALRQACLAQESRIAHVEPKLPDLVIESVSVSNSAFLGPIEFQFNPQYNALIGGRGTGKSTILEYLRWGLCDQTPMLEDDELPNYQARRAKLIDNTLRPLGASVDVSFSVNGVTHVVRRNSKDGSLIIKVGSDEFRDCSEVDVREIFPIQAYSQKQLSNVSVRVEELFRFITAPIRAELAQIDRRIADSAARIRQNYVTRQRQQALSNELEKREIEGRSLEEQAEAVRKSLSGLSDADRGLLDQGKKYDALNREFLSWVGDIRAVSNGIDNIIEIVNDRRSKEFDYSSIPEQDTVRQIWNVYEGVFSEVKSKLDALQEDIRAKIGDAASDELVSPWCDWQRKYAEFRVSYQNAVDRSSVHKERMENLRNIEARLVAHQNEVLRITDEIKSLRARGDHYTLERKAWCDLCSERDVLYQQQCQILTETSNGSIRARVQRFADVKNFTDRLKEALRGSGVRSDRLDALASTIAHADDPLDKWDGIIDDLEKLASFDVAQLGVERKPGTPNLAKVGFTSGDIDKIAKKLSPEEWLVLSLVEIQSSPIFEYKSRENQYIPFNNASSGQQATALLKTLLNQDGPPLLIDQPEEDLDNPVMQEIVEQIWSAKQKRQIIFVSHNANLVVNGDAELVAWCDYRKAGDQSGGKIAGEGAIDIPDVRDAIKRIMEGGEAAFRLRREKYGF